MQITGDPLVQALLDSPLPTAILGPDGRVGIANAAFAARVGRPLEALAGTPWIQLGHELAGAVVTRIPGPGGTPGGRLVQVPDGAGRDPAAGQDAGSALAATEHLVRSAMSALRDGVIVYDRTGRIVAASRSVREMLGRDSTELVGRRVQELGWRLLAPDGQELAPGDHPIRGTLTDGLPRHDVVVRFVNEHERVLWLRVSTEPLRAADGRLEGMVGSFTDITEQHRDEQELRRSEERFRVVLETLDEGVAVLGCTLGPDGAVARATVELINERTRQQWLGGRPSGEVLGRDLAELDPAWDAPIRANCSAVLASGRPLRVELVYPHPTLGDRTLEVRMSAFPGQRVLLVAADITEQAHLTDELRASERRFRTLLEAFDEGIAILSPVMGEDGSLVDARVDWANATARRGWFGDRPLEVVAGRPLGELDAQGNAHDLPRAEARLGAYRAVLASGRMEQAELPWRSPDGQPMWLHHRVVPLEGGLLHVAADVTERHLARAALEEAYQIGRIGVWSRDPVSGDVSWSPEMFVIFGMDPAAGPPDLETAGMLGGESLETMLRRVTAHQAVADEWETERELRQPDGTPVWVLTRTRVDRGPDGSVRRYRGVTMDITRRKSAEIALEALNTQLERRVAERTAELEAANEELRSFSYSLSHDLRAPLRAIAGFAGMLDRSNGTALDEAGRRRLSNILTATDTMGRVIDDLLLYLRLGQGAIRREPVPLEPLMDTVRVAQAPLLESTGGRIELVRPLAVPIADRTLLQEVLGNLVENALHYHRPEVPPVVRVSAVAVRDGVEVRVTDNGVGIDPAAQERIFEAFTRLTTDERHPGTGIGLSIVRRAARAMGGDVTLESVPGEGSTFRLLIPAAG